MDTNDIRKQRFVELLGAELKAAIAASQTSALDVATRTGIHKVSLSRYFNGHRAMPIDALFQICEAIGISPDSVVDRAYDRLTAELGEVATKSNGIEIVRNEIVIERSAEKLPQVAD